MSDIDPVLRYHLIWACKDCKAKDAEIERLRAMVLVLATDCGCDLACEARRHALEGEK